MQANISSKNLRGLSLKDENLKGINLSKEDIRGLDFTEADLTGAILNGATCGVETWWTIPILIISLFIMSLSGFSASIIVNCNLYYFSRIHGVLKNIFTSLISIIYITWLHAYFLKKLPKYLMNIGLMKKEDIIEQGSSIDQSALIFVGIIIIIIVGILIPFIINMDESNDKDVNGYYVVISMSVFVILVNLLLLAYFSESRYDITRRAAGAFIGSILGIIISNQAILKKEKKYVWIWNLFVYLISAKGTKFHGSTLDDASFANVNIKGSSFINCTVNRTSWEGVKRIDCSRIQGNYLDNPKIRDLVIKKRTGKVKDYRDMNLQGLNLFGANLEKIDLSEADLSNSQLTKAELQDSTLSQTRLDNVDLRDANITGTTIEMKSIPATAKLDGLICDFFYPQSNPKQRYPIIGKLTSLEAIKLLQKPSEIKIIFKKDGIDWQAFLQAFEKCLKELKISFDNSEKLIQGFKR
ncbi:MAG: pentapeptide repeat-containing protein [Nostoc sp.]|uniref:pentapeptide repeat-containing protein n=1 Tax=Nostoc sp. TaxID=1180 RepID=UPI002FF6EF67